MSYSKAKDAARVVRRLEYSINMTLNMMYSKPIHKKMQKWFKIGGEFFGLKGKVKNL